jgi:hypothetical protein
MISLLLSLCSVLSPTWVNAQPVVSWDPSFTADAYTVHWREDGGAWQDCPQLHCWPRDDGGQGCWGQDVYVPLQRCIALADREVEVGITAENVIGQSGMSNTVTVCLPHIWQAGEVYE